MGRGPRRRKGWRKRVVIPEGEEVEVTWFKAMPSDPQPFVEKKLGQVEQ